jgi:hypothetical protein
MSHNTKGQWRWQINCSKIIQLITKYISTQIIRNPGMRRAVSRVDTCYLKKPSPNNNKNMACKDRKE